MSKRMLFKTKRGVPVYCTLNDNILAMWDGDVRVGSVEFEGKNGFFAPATVRIKRAENHMTSQPHTWDIVRHRGVVIPALVAWLERFHAKDTVVLIAAPSERVRDYLLTFSFKMGPRVGSAYLMHAFVRDLENEQYTESSVPCLCFAP